jgi:hypothetical protein
MTTKTITPLRQRMTEDMNARKLCSGTQRGHIRSCKRFAAKGPQRVKGVCAGSKWRPFKTWVAFAAHWMNSRHASSGQNVVN